MGLTRGLSILSTLSKNRKKKKKGSWFFPIFKSLFPLIFIISFLLVTLPIVLGSSDGKEASACNVMRHKFNPWVRDDPLEKGMVIHFSIFAWRIPRTDHAVAKSQTRQVDSFFLSLLTLAFVFSSNLS